MMEMSKDKEYGKVLIQLVKGAIRERLGLGEPPHFDYAWLKEKLATFVTLYVGGELLGCIGTIEPHRSLEEDVKANALAAAFSDPRFPSLRKQDLSKLQIEVSLLTPLNPISFQGENDAQSKLRPFEDGVVLECAGYKSTFLPQVWEKLPDAKSFLRNLKKKAGFSEDFWSDDIKLYRYSVQKWTEQ